MFHRALLIATAGLLVAAVPKDDEALTLAARPSLDGIWELIWMQDDRGFAFEGSTLSLPLLQVEIKGNRFIRRPGQWLLQDVTFHLNPCSSPARIDVNCYPSRAPCPGIYLIDGDTLTICYSEEGSRPTTFPTRAQSRDGQMCYIFRRFRP